MNSIITIILSLLISIATFAHGGHQSHQELLDIIEKKLILSERVNFKKPKTNSLTLQFGSDTYHLSDAAIVEIIKSAVQNFQKTHHEGECNHHHQEVSESGMKKMVAKFKSVSSAVGHFFEGIIWDTYPGIRRFGPIYAVLVIVGEVIDHSISFIPLCKFVNFAVLFIALKAKIFTYNIIGIGDISTTAFQRFKIILSRRQYKKQYRDYLKEVMKRNIPKIEYDKFSQRVKAFFQSFSNTSQIHKMLPDSTLTSVSIGLEQEIDQLFAESYGDDFQKSWIIERKFEALNLYLGIMKDQADYLKKSKILPRGQYAKLLWSWGALGNMLDNMLLSHRFAIYKAQNNELEQKEINRIKRQQRRFLKKTREFNELLQRLADGADPKSSIRQFQERVNKTAKLKRKNCLEQIISFSKI